MKFQKLMQTALLAGAACTASAQAQTYYGGGGYNPSYNDNRANYRADVRGDFRKREQLERRIEADRRAVEHERRDLRHAGWFNAGQEHRELRDAERRLDRDVAELRALDAHFNRDLNRGSYGGYR